MVLTVTMHLLIVTELKTCVFISENMKMFYKADLRNPLRVIWFGSCAPSGQICTHVM